MLKINEAAKMLHVNPNALRFYEKKGVLAPHRDENGYRMYTMDDVARIQIVLLYRRMGFSIEMILKLLGQEESPVDLFFQQYDILNRHVHSMSLIRDSLAGCIDGMLGEINGTEDGGSGSNAAIPASAMEELEKTAALLAGMAEWEDRWDFDSSAVHYDEMVRRGVNGLAFYENYETVLNETARLAREHGGTMAEIGVGTGELAGRRLSDCEITGIDQSVNMLKETKKKFPKLKVKLGTFLQLPMDSGSVDTVVSSYAFHHCNEEEKILAVKEMARILKPAGRIVIADLMFADEEARKIFAENCSDAEREDLEDEYFAYVDRLEGVLETLGFDARHVQVDPLIWIVTGDRRDGD